MTCAADVPDSVPIGGPLSHCIVHVLDRHGQPVPVGVAGELHIGGQGVGKGYLNVPDLTAARFVDIEFPSQPRRRFYRSGDRVRWRPDGLLEFLGRIDQQIKLRGLRIEPGEIENHLLELPAVKEAAVVLRNDQGVGRRLVAYLVAAERGAIDVAVVRRHLGETLLRYMVPAAFMVIDHLPLTRNGKLDHRALPPPTGGGGATDSSEPGNPVERCLCDIWAQTLNLGKVSVHDNFFELGGDSILSMQIVMRAAGQGVKITLRQILQHQTVAELARVAVKLGEDPRGPAPTVPVAVPLTPIQSWFFDLDLAAPQHWNQSVLLRLRRPVELAVLAAALNALQERHDALRLRFVRQPEGWTAQAVPAGPTVPLTVHLPNGAGLSNACTEEQAGLDLGAGPLFRAALFRGEGGDLTGRCRGASPRGRCSVVANSRERSRHAADGRTPPPAAPSSNGRTTSPPPPAGRWPLPRSSASRYPAALDPLPCDDPAGRHGGG